MPTRSRKNPVQLAKRHAESRRIELMRQLWADDAPGAGRHARRFR